MSKNSVRYECGFLRICPYNARTFFVHSQAEEGSIQRKVYLEKLKDRQGSYLSTGKEMANVLLRDAKTLMYGSLTDVFLYDSEKLLEQHENKDGYTNFLSFVFPRGSELGPFFSYFTLKLKESGIMK